MAGVKRALKAAALAAGKEISVLASCGGMYAKGMASEGFMGGYREALEDVMLAMNGVEPDRWRRWRELEFNARVVEKGASNAT
jgi:hypothetical protein